MKTIKGLIAGAGLVALLSGCSKEFDSFDYVEYGARRYDGTINYKIENDALWDTVEGEKDKENRIFAGRDSELRRCQ